MKYCDKLPRRNAHGHRCNVLNEDGERCPRMGQHEVSAHLDNEIYGSGADWVAIYVCQEHFDSQYVWKEKKTASSDT